MFVAVATMAGCKTPAVVAPVVHNKDSVRIEYQYKHDSIYTDRWHTILQKGDTLLIRDSIFIHEYKLLEKHDTLSLQRIDSIPYPVEVEKQLTSGQRFLMNSGIACWCLVALIVLLGITALIIRIYKK